ncbi:hypothetical protein ACFFHH_05745 [Cytobacillus solani]|nr:hypothetical protein [Cytobacillus solani]USK53056.1 hypothetical protein LIS82_15670 [Cytobacillus solani]
MSLGNKVKYNEDIYIIVHIYESGFVEIKDVKHLYNVELVRMSDIKVIE